MPNLLYLDTARLGQMSPRARRASTDFARCASEFGGSLYLTDFLQHGVGAWPDHYVSEYPALEDWNGIAPLKRDLRSLAQGRPDSEVLLAARSANLMKFAARLLYRPCRNILITELTWPLYERILRREQPTAACRITRVPLRRALFSQRLSETELVAQLAQAYKHNQCDGLFLPLVDNLGIQLPLTDIVERIRSESEVRFVVVDGAQAIHHVPLALAADYCDFLLAGCHKWLRAFTPMGVGFYGHPISRDYVRNSLTSWMNEGAIDDPLLSYTVEMQSGQANPFGETVGVSPMIAANSAVNDALSADLHASNVEQNRNMILTAATTDGWSCLSPAKDFASRILIFQSSHDRDRQMSPDELRRRFVARNVAVSAYGNGIVRLSTPTTPLKPDEAFMLRTAFSQRGQPQ